MYKFEKHLHVWALIRTDPKRQNKNINERNI